MYNFVMLDNVSENGDHREVEKFVKSEKILPGSDGWLSPSGGYYQAKSTEHDDAAEWIVINNLSELQKGVGRKHRIRSDSEIFEKSGFAPRQFLNDNRWILINGPVFHTEDALNYTTKQLELLEEAGIPIIGAFDGSKEFSTKETLEWVNKIAERVSDFLQNTEVQVWNSRKGVSEKIRIDNQNEYWKKLGNLGYSTIEDFKRDPFHAVFGDFGPVRFNDMMDVISEGYKDEIVFDRGMETYTLRLFQLPSGERICVEHTFHHHDRDWGNEDHMNAYVVDKVTFDEKVKKYLSTGIRPKVKGEYFKKFFAVE